MVFAGLYTIFTQEADRGVWCSFLFPEFWDMFLSILSKLTTFLFIYHSWRFFMPMWIRIRIWSRFWQQTRQK
jgi:hypothetical protein